MIKCCKDCAERHLHCHSSCKKYIHERKELDKANAFLRKDDDYIDYACVMRVRNKKHKKHK